MLINLNDQLENHRVVELLSYSIFPDPDRIRGTVKQYAEEDSMEIYGIQFEDEIVAVIGFRLDDQGNNIEITNISVDPEYRGLGYGRGQILELIALYKPKRIIAETDEEAVDFYRNIGFTVSGLGEKYPGVERFRCEFVVD